jgi:predicted RNase H-like nuclease (RuvC/YqgF family)
MKELTTSHTPTEETSRFVHYESKIAALNSEVTNLKVELANTQSYVKELENTLHQNSIPLPDELKAMKKKEEERQLHMKVIAFMNSLPIGRRRKGGDKRNCISKMDRSRSSRYPKSY